MFRWMKCWAAGSSRWNHKELCGHLPCGHHRGPWLQHHVRAVRPINGDVLLPKQAHHDRSRDGKQLQDQLGPQGQARVHWHRGDGLQGCPEGPWSGDRSQGLLHQVPLLRRTGIRSGCFYCCPRVQVVSLVSPPCVRGTFTQTARQWVSASSVS